MTPKWERDMYSRQFATISALTIVIGLVVGIAFAQESDRKVTRYARFQVGETVAYGVVEGDRIRQLQGDLFGRWERTDRTHPLSAVKLLVPSAHPTQVLALAGNYKSHLGGG